MKEILLVAGTRPNFIKLAPLFHTLKKSAHFNVRICHTGQHYDHSMSDVFWQLLNLPAPDFLLHASGGTSAEIVGKTILGLNELFLKTTFDLVIVFGDVNATAAGAIVSTHFRAKLMHVESGLRSYDRNMPEEINRVITDHLADYLMVSEESGLINLNKEGIDQSKIFFVGNIMIESLIKTRHLWEAIDLREILRESEKDYAVVTFHRPENVDQIEALSQIVKTIGLLSRSYTVVFPIHPRTKKKLVDFELMELIEGNSKIIITDPVDYFVFLKLISKSSGVVTDSGGVQEETSFLRIPCVTVRKNTERPVTITHGTNRLASLWDAELAHQVTAHFIEAKNKVPVLSHWDEKVSERIVTIIETHFG